jgi:drug/metabolite transporter (DMT)-like permease
LSKEIERTRTPVAITGIEPRTPDEVNHNGPVRRPLLSATSLALLLFCVASAATGQLLLKHGMNLATASATKTNSSLVVKAATSPWILIGLGIFAISAVAWLATLSRVPLGIAYPFNALGYIAILTASTLLLHERTNMWTWLGTGFVAVGLVIVVVTKP